MATDVARLSYDPARGYRGVVPQQGRVSLEAEQNEQRVLDSTERRLELIDIVGPAGTPDDGYAVSGNPGSGEAFEITVGAGTMYVGGWRLELPADLGDYRQPDWLDRPRHWKETGREHVLLMVTDTDVTAVEDPALYEVALGGPDGSARTRLLQRIVRRPTEGATCAEALTEDRRQWAKEGLTFDPDTMALESVSRLLVSWEGDPEPADPCEPASVGGYLGAENQLIRVQIVKTGRDGTFDLVWGYDDASALYRVSADASADPVLTLDRSPVDDYHRPRAGQAVQVLRATAELPGTDGVVEGYVAALGGPVGVLAAPYDPDTKTVRFPAPLPAGYTDPDENPQLFLRVWEELVTGAQLGSPIRLTGTGLVVTISNGLGRGGPHADDFWCIGVRPSTPTAVYPERYLRVAQPPDGPHRWVCPLAVIEWQANDTFERTRRAEHGRERAELVVLEDCRRHFKPLTELQTDGCCTIEVHPSDAASGRLQALLDRAAAGRQPAHRESHITVCFSPGRYELREPLVLRRRHSNLTLRGCSEGAVLAAHPDETAAFGNGLLVLADVDNVTVTGLEFVLPQVPVALAKAGATGLFDRAAVRGINEAAAGRYLSIGIRPVDCAVLEVSDCLFRYSVGEHQSTPETERTMPRSVFAAGMLLSGRSWGLRVSGNRFLHHPAALPEDSEVTHTLVGLMHIASVALASVGGKRVNRLGSARLPALLEDAAITDNTFDGVTAAVAVAADLGRLRVWDNVIRNAYQGITILGSLSAAGLGRRSHQADSDRADSYQADSYRAHSEQVRDLHETLAGGLLDPVLAEALVLGATLPLPDLPDFEPAGVQPLPAEDPEELHRRAAEYREAAFGRLAHALAAEHPADQTAAGQPSTARADQAAHQPAAEPDETGYPVREAEMARRSGMSSGMLAALDRLADFDAITPAAGKLATAISVERNVVDCTVALNEKTSWALTLVLQRQENAVPTAIVGSNRLTSLQPPYVAAISTLAGAAVTGNIVAADSARYHSLVVADVEAPAITSNVLVGVCVLPENRPFPAPLDTWLPLNTVF
ncbi:MAG: hypothetical protein JO144_13050 [Actinobacteria bacterium]|nr:hypothetical protein [Actinomycetota bacterium]